MSETTNVMNSEVVKRLLCYVSYDTQSKDESDGSVLETVLSMQ